MIDLKKEIRLSDLARRPQRQTTPGTRTAPQRAQKRLLSRRPKRRELIGLKVGGSQLAAARIANNGSAQLLQLARRPLPAGLVVGGEVRDVSALAAALDEFFSANKLPRRGVRLGVATNRIGVRAFEMAGINDERQLANAVLFRAPEALAIPLEEAVLDYQIVSETVDETGTVNRKILLAAAYRESIDRYVAACHQARIELVGIELEAFALLRALAPAPDPEAAPAAVVAVAIGHDRSTLAISDGLVCDFTRVLEWGGATLDDAIARELNLTPFDAAELKLRLSLTAAAALGGPDAPDEARGRETVRRELQTLARELVTSLQFYQGQPGSLAIGQILLTGGTSQLPGLAEELERLTRVRVRTADPLARVQAAEALRSEAHLPSLASAIGLAIEPTLRPINLLPEAARGGTQWAAGQGRRPAGKRVLVAAGATAAVAAAACGTLFVHERNSVHAKHTTLSGLQQKVAAAQATTAATDAGHANTQARAATLTSLAQQRLAWEKVLHDLARVLPADARLQSLQAAAAAAAPDAAAATTSTASTPGTSAATPSTFTIDGFTSSQYGVALVLDRLALLPWLSDVTLQQSVRSQDSNGPTMQFTIGANLRSRGGQQ
jgi:type IV pilus assembly protein PilM